MSQIVFKKDNLSVLLLCSLIVAVTYLLKFAVPIGGGTRIFLALFVIYGAVCIGVLTSHLEVHKARLAAYLVLVGGLSTTQILGSTNFSLLSLAFMMVVHLPYIFQLKQNSAPPFAGIVFFQRTMVVLAIIGIIQYFAQFVIGADNAFYLDRKFPQDFIMPYFHGFNPLGYMGTVYKSNGFFVQEPSNFSQFLALALIIEIIYFLNWKRIALYLVAISLTFSGTGLITLFVLTPFYLIMKRRFLLLFGMIAFVVSAPLWAPLVGLEHIVSRATEFKSEKSSGYARFISPARIIEERILPEGPQTILFGLGAGSMLRTMGQGADYETATSTWSKPIYEYGFMGGILYFVFMGYMFHSNCKSLYIVFALIIQFYFLGEHVLPPTVHALILALLVWPNNKPQPVKNELADIDAQRLFPRLKEVPHA